MNIGDNNKFFFYISLGEKAATMEYIYDMNGKVDPEALKLAVKDAVESFPFFQLRPYIGNKGELIMEKNNADVPVNKQDGKKVALGSEDTNGYLFRVLYEDNKITVVASHAIGDGRGISSFAQTVVYYYLIRKGVSINTEGMIYTKEDISDETIRDILSEKAASMKTKEVDIPQKVDNIFFPDEDKCYRGTPDTRQFRIVWNQEQFMEKVKGVGGTPLTFVHSILAQTMYEYYKLENQNIVGNVPVDMRARLGSRAQSNFTVNVDLVITKDILKLDMSEQMRILRSNLKAVTDTDVLLNQIVGLDYMYDILNKIAFNDLEAIDKLANRLLSNIPSRSYLLSNIGLVKLPKDMEPYITNVDIMFTNLEATPVYTMLTYGNRGTLIIGQNYEDKGFMEALCNKFASYGVESTLSDCGLVRSDAVKVSEFSHKDY